MQPENIALQLAAFASPAGQETDPLERIATLLAGRPLPARAGTALVQLAVNRGSGDLAIRLATLLATDPGGDPGGERTLMVAQLRTAAGQLAQAASLADVAAGRAGARIDRPDYAARLAAIFISCDRVDRATQLVLNRLGEGPAWRQVAVALLPALAGQPDAQSRWIRQLAAATPEDDQATWAALAAGATHLVVTHNRRDAAADVRDHLDGFAAATAPSQSPSPSGTADGWRNQLTGRLSLALGDPERTARYYDQVLAREPDNAAALNNYAHALAHAGQRLDEALSMARRAVDLLPETAGVYDTLTLVHLARDEPAEALVSARRAVELQPTAAGRQVTLARALLADGNLDEAQQILDGLSERLGPDHPDRVVLTPVEDGEFRRLRNALSRDQLLAADANEGADAPGHSVALAMARRAAGLSPDNPDVYENLARIHLDRAEPAEALVAARRAFELQPDTARSQLTLARALLAGGNTDDAQRMLDGLHDRLEPNAPDSIALTASERKELKELSGTLQRSSEDGAEASPRGADAVEE